MTKLVFLPEAAKYIKKLKDKKLKEMFQLEVDKIIINPFIGEAKKDYCQVSIPVELGIKKPIIDLHTLFLKLTPTIPSL